MSSNAKHEAPQETPAPNIILNKILIPIDFSEHSKNALAYGVLIAKQFGAELFLLYVVEPTVYPHDFGFGHVGMTALENELRAKGMQELEKLIETKVAGQVNAKPLVGIGKPYEEISNFAAEENIDLIIIATRGHTDMEQILFGGTAEKVVRKAPCPVLTWRERNK